MDNKQKSNGNNFDIESLVQIKGIQRFEDSEVPDDLISRTESDFFSCVSYFKLDDVSGWRSWNNLKTQNNLKDIWMFYGCPEDMISSVLSTKEILPYGGFFPRIFGENARYFFRDSEPAARTAFKFGICNEGLVISCRLLADKIYNASDSMPASYQAPEGYDTIRLQEGTDIGGIQFVGDMYVSYDPEKVLIRYISHIRRLKDI